MSGTAVVVAVFAATALEMVEALTIVLAVGISRGWRSALEGAGVALLILAVGILVGGVTLLLFIADHYLTALRLVAGLLLLYFGQQWLLKAIRRASGLKAKRNEAESFRKTVSELTSQREARGRDTLGFTTAFKGVLLEGFEAALFAVTIGSTSQRMGLAAASAAAAIAVVAVAGAMAHRPLTRVPENALGFTVGIALVSFGIFWVGEGLRLEWPGSDASILGIAAVVGGVSGLAVALLSRRQLGTN